LLAGALSDLHIHYATEQPGRAPQIVNLGAHERLCTDSAAPMALSAASADVCILALAFNYRGRRWVDREKKGR
jgi:hypothetical protein